jgi:lipocalin-like protein
MTNRIRIALGALALLAGASLGCGDSGGATGPSASSLVGTWNAVKVELVSLAEPTAKIDGLAGGATLTMTVNADHTWQTVQTDPVDPDLFGQGTWSLSGSTLTITEQGESVNFKVKCDGSTMTLTASTTWDYDMDGTEEPAKMTLMFEK